METMSIGLAVVVLCASWDQNRIQDAIFVGAFKDFWRAAGIVVEDKITVNTVVGEDTADVYSRGLSARIGKRSHEVRHASCSRTPIELAWQPLRMSSDERIRMLRKALKVPSAWVLQSVNPHEDNGTKTINTFWQAPQPSSVPVHGAWNSALIVINTEFGLLTDFHLTNNISIGKGTWTLTTSQALMLASDYGIHDTPTGIVSRVHSVPRLKFNGYHDTPIQTRPAYRVELATELTETREQRFGATLLDATTGSLLDEVQTQGLKGAKADDGLSGGQKVAMAESAINIWARQTGILDSGKRIALLKPRRSSNSSCLFDTPSGMFVVGNKSHQVFLYVNKPLLSKFRKPNAGLDAPISRQTLVRKSQDVLRALGYSKWALREAYVPRQRDSIIEGIPDRYPPSIVEFEPQGQLVTNGWRNSILMHFDACTGDLLYYRLIDNVGQPTGDDKNLLSSDECRDELGASLIEGSASGLWLSKELLGATNSGKPMVYAKFGHRLTRQEIATTWPEEQVNPRPVTIFTISEQPSNLEIAVDRMTGRIVD